MRVAGLLLAAGRGRRFGGPKPLAELGGEPLVLRALGALTEGGCEPVHVVVGARSEAVRALLPRAAVAVHAADWTSGMGASLRAGLGSFHGLEPAPDALLVHLVDLPWVPAGVVARLAGYAGPSAVARACYRGTPGHPVVLGRRWWAEVAGATEGDRGARDWLAARPDLRLVECADLGSGADVDTRADLGVVE
ncbi:nucleotidyltransferase family protein [Amycolatopsis cihanbeyliensis]